MSDQELPASGMVDATALSPYVEKLCGSLTAGWIPCNAAWLSEIQARIKDGIYDRSVDLLVEDIRQDFSLFAYCVRELAQVISSYTTQDDARLDPVRTLKRAQLSQLKAVLNVKPGAVSPHLFEAGKEFQTRILVMSMKAARAAEALSPSYQINSETAFSCGLFRQLGLALIAWNYPHVYSRVVLQFKSDTALDQALGRLLGVTPSLLGITLARQWRLSPAVLGGMGDREAQESPEIKATAERLEKLCKMGESIARASDPKNYPEAIHDWSAAKVEIERLLGDRGMQTLLDRVDGACRAYRSLCPQMFQAPEIDSARVEISVREGFGAKLFKRNTHIAQCPEFLKVQLRGLYSRMDGRSMSSEAIQTLIRQSAIAVGFSRGCVYLVEPERQVLAPRLNLGETRHCRCRVTSYSLDGSSENLVTQAYNSSSVLMSSGASLCLAGVIGGLDRLGVLYLEMPKENLEMRQEALLECFSAINQALGDCLSIF